MADSATTAQITDTPNTDFNGTDSFTFQVSDEEFQRRHVDAADVGAAAKVVTIRCDLAGAAAAMRRYAGAAAEELRGRR